jgi:hypothetical protein
MAKHSKLGTAFIENFQNVAQDVAEQEIVKCLQKISLLKEEMAADPKLSELKEMVKDLAGGYKSVIKVEKAKIDFFVEKIEEIQSGEVNPTSSAK